MLETVKHCHSAEQLSVRGIKCVSSPKNRFIREAERGSVSALQLIKGEIWNEPQHLLT